jgi:3-oxoadipate enol-lactonase
VAHAQRDGMAALVDTTMRRWFTDPFIARGGDAAVRQRLATDDVRAWCDGFTAMANVDTASKLNTIKVPTLCLAGEVDKSTPPPVVKAMADAIPGARFAMLPGAPHMPFVEMPQDVANAVMPFLKQALA